MEANYAQHLHLEVFVNQELPQVQLQNKYLLRGLGLVVRAIRLLVRAVGSKYMIHSVQNTLFTLSQSFNHGIFCKV
jgi:hypothetical protein